MICTFCGGEVTWRGPITNLTHTECNQCGAANCQIMDEPNEDDEEDED